MDPDALSAATRLGMLVGEARDPAAAHEALDLVLRVLGGDAASLVAVDLHGRPSTMAARGYPTRVAECLTHDFPVSRWQSMVLGAGLPPSISTEAEQTFRAGWIYGDVIEPAGLRDGVSCALHWGCSYVGTVHVSSADPSFFGPRRRRLLAAIAKPLAGLVDPVSSLQRRAGVEADSRLCLLGEGGDVVAVPGREVPLVASDSEFRHLVGCFEAVTGRMTLLWPVSASRWFRVRVTADRRAIGGRGVLVEERAVYPPYGLSRRELDVLTRVAIGMSNDAVAVSLVLSARTVHTHVEHILRKTGARTRTEAAALALHRRLLRPSPDLLAGPAAPYFLPAE